MELNKRLKNFIKVNKDEDIQLLKGFDVDRIHEDPTVSEDIRETLESNLNRLNELNPTISEDTEVLLNLQSLDEIPKDELYELEDLASDYAGIMSQRNMYQGLVDRHEEDTMYLEKYREEIPKAIDRIEEFEGIQGKVKKDMYILEGEKGELDYRKNRNITAFNFTKVFLIFVVVITAIISLVFMTMSLFYSVNVLIPGLITVIVIIISILWVTIFRRYLAHDIKKVQKLKGRAVELLNKTKLKYIKNQTLLDYEYKKYRVNSSEMLKVRWENLNENVKNEKTFSTIESEVDSIKTAINRILLRTGMDRTDKLLEFIEYFVNKDTRQKVVKLQTKELEKLVEEKEFYEKQNRILTKILRDYES